MKVYIIISLLPTKEKLRARGKRGLLLLLQVYTLWFIYLEPKKVLAVWRRRGMAKWNTPRYAVASSRGSLPRRLGKTEAKTMAYEYII